MNDIFEGLTLGKLKSGVPKSELLLRDKEIANLSAYVDIDERTIPSQGKIYDLFDGSNNHSAGLIDSTMTTAISNLSAGDTDIASKVNTSEMNTSWFQTGQEVTIQDDENKEWVTVTEGGITEEETTIDKSTPVTAVNAANTTYSSARPHVLSNGWLIKASSSGRIRFYVNKNPMTSDTWELLVDVGFNPNVNLAFTTVGTWVYCVYSYSVGTARFEFDASTITVNGIGTAQNFNVSSSAGEWCHIIQEDNMYLHVTFAEKQPSYPNSYNIRYCKGTISANGSVVWGSVAQITNSITSGVDFTKPRIAIDSNGKVVIICIFKNTTPNYGVQIIKNTTELSLTTLISASGWSRDWVHNLTGYVQDYPDLDVASDGSIWVSWQGYESGYEEYNIKCSKSLNGGQTWVKPSNGSSGYDRLTNSTINGTAQVVPSITIDIDNNVYIMWAGIDTSVSSSYNQIRRIVWNGSTWSSIVTLTSNTANHASLPSTCNNYRSFTDPLCIYRDSQASAVKFRGVWSATSQIPHLIVTPLQHAYKANAKVYRSLGKIVDGKMKFSDGFFDSEAIDVSTPVTVVNSAYTTSASARPQVLSNGWHVNSVYDTTNVRIRIEVSKDNGTTFSHLCYIPVNALVNWSMASKGTFVYIIKTDTDNCCRMAYFDAVAVVSGSSVSAGTVIDSSQTAIGGCSLTMISDQAYLYAVWSSKNSNYSNSFNIRYCKGTINSDGSVSWGSVEQITTYNTINRDATTPCLVSYNNYPLIVYQFTDTPNNYYQISWTRWTGSAWTSVTAPLYGVYTYPQSLPSADVDSDGVIHVVWEGTDGADTTINNIRYSKSIDGGVTWSTMLKLTSGNISYLHQSNPCITIDKNNNLYVLWVGRTATSDTYYQLRKIIYTLSSSSWGDITTLTTNTIDSISSPSLCNNYRRFTDPICIYHDNEANAVKFRGTWSIDSYTPLLSEDLRYNITPLLGTTNEIVSWLQFDKPFSNDFAVIARLSLVNTTSSENFVTMTNTASGDINDNTIEDEWQGNSITAERVTLKLTMERNITGVNKGISKLLGVVRK